MGQQGKFSVGYDRIARDLDRAQVSYSYPISQSGSLVVGVSHTSGVVRDTRVMFGVTFAFGGSSNQTQYNRSTINPVDARTLARSTAQSADVAPLASLGKVETMAASVPTLVSSTLTGTILKDPAPIAGGAFAALADMTVSDATQSININAG